MILLIYSEIQSNSIYRLEYIQFSYIPNKYFLNPFTIQFPIDFKTVNMRYKLNEEILKLCIITLIISIITICT